MTLIKLNRAKLQKQFENLTIAEVNRLYVEKPREDRTEVIQLPAKQENSAWPLQAPSDLSETEEQAVELVKQGKLRESESIYRRLIANGENTYTVYGNLAAICGMQNRFEEVIELLHKTLTLKPDYPEAHYNLGIALKKKGDVKAAIASYKNALQLEPNYAEAHYSLGIALHQQGDLDNAISEFRAALQLQENYPEAHYNLGVSLKKQGDLTGAIASYSAALKLKPDYPKAHYNLGNAFQDAGDPIGAISAFKTALKLKPNYTKASLNLAMAELLVGDYKSGLKRYEFRFKNKDKKFILNAVPPCKLWDGNLTSKNLKLLLVSEQGLGDTLQFMRYAIVLKNLGISVSLCAQPKLHSLIKTSDIDQAPLTPEQANKFSEGRWIPLLSVPQYLNISPDNPIITHPYINAPEKYIEKWKHILTGDKKPIIGINWQGNPLHETTNSKGRSIPLESFAPLTKTPNIKLLSLQKGLGSEQLERCSFKDHFVGSQDQINDTWDFVETAAIVANCDLVITSDTSVAHLAGGMGKTTWLLLKTVPEWRWGLEGESTFWYPSMRLFRQRERGNWDEVLQRVADALEEHFESNIDVAHTMAEQKSRPKPIQDILAPVSLGELIDKITILQIKRAHARGKSIDNIEHELNELNATLERLSVDVDQAVIDQLKCVNQELWNIEDSIRDCERQKSFGEDFIDLARAIYQKNDYRAALKKEINIIYGSALIEEKLYREY